MDLRERLSYGPSGETPPNRRFTGVVRIPKDGALLYATESVVSDSFAGILSCSRYAVTLRELGGFPYARSRLPHDCPHRGRKRRWWCLQRRRTASTAESFRVSVAVIRAGKRQAARQSGARLSAPQHRTHCALCQRGGDLAIISAPRDELPEPKRAAGCGVAASDPNPDVTTVKRPASGGAAHARKKTLVAHHLEPLAAGCGHHPPGNLVSMWHPTDATVCRRYFRSRGLSVVRRGVVVGQLHTHSAVGIDGIRPHRKRRWMMVNLLLPSDDSTSSVADLPMQRSVAKRT